MSRPASSIPQALASSASDASSRLAPPSAESREEVDPNVERLAAILSVRYSDVVGFLRKKYDLNPQQVLEAITVPGIRPEQQAGLLNRFLINGEDLSSESEDGIDVADGYKDRYGGGGDVLESIVVRKEMDRLGKIEHGLNLELEKVLEDLAQKQQDLEYGNKEVFVLQEELKSIIEAYQSRVEEARLKSEDQPEETDTTILEESLEDKTRRVALIIEEIEPIIEHAESLRKEVEKVRQSKAVLTKKLEEIEEQHYLREKVLEEKSTEEEDIEEKKRKDFFEDRKKDRWSSNLSSLEGVEGRKDSSTVKKESLVRKTSQYFERFGGNPCPTTHRERRQIEENCFNSLSVSGLEAGETFRVLDVGGGGGRFYEALRNFWEKKLHPKGIKMEIISQDIVGIDKSFAALLVENGFKRDIDGVDPGSSSSAITKFSRVPPMVSDRDFLRKKEEFVGYSKHPVTEIDTPLGPVQDLGSFISSSGGIKLHFINTPAVPRGKGDEIPPQVEEMMGAVRSVLGQNSDKPHPIHASMSMFGSLAHVMHPGSREAIFRMMHDVTKGCVCYTMPTRKAHPYVVAASNLRRIVVPEKHGRESKNFPGEARYKPTDADATTKPVKRFPYWHGTEDQLRESFSRAGFPDFDLRPASYRSPVHLIGNDSASAADDTLIERDLAEYQTLLEEGKGDKALERWQEIMDKSSYLEIRAQGAGYAMALEEARARESATGLEGLESSSQTVPSLPPPPRTSSPAASPENPLANPLLSGRSRDGSRN